MAELLQEAWLAEPIPDRGVPHIAHYLDDFVMVGAHHSSQCADSLQTMNLACKELGVPMAAGKCEGPMSCLTFLGIELDTVAWSLRLPADKITRIKATLLDWNDRKACRRRELESLIGLLQHACKVVKPGRSFLRSMINLLSGLFTSTSTDISARTLLVEHLHIRLEWHRLHAQSRRRASSFLLRCSRIMGLRGVLESPLVADSMHGMHDRSLSPFP